MRSCMPLLLMVVQVWQTYARSWCYAACAERLVLMINLFIRSSNWVLICWFVSFFRCSLRPDLGYVQGLVVQLCKLCIRAWKICRNVVHRHDAPHQHGRVWSLCVNWKLAATPLFRTFYFNGCSRNVLTLEMCLRIASARDARFKYTLHSTAIFHRLVFDELVITHEGAFAVQSFKIVL